MNFINLTPHVLNIISGAATTNVAPSGEVARCRVTYTPDGEVGGIPVYVAVYGEVTGLPEACPGKAYVVSGLVAAHPSVTGRSDVFAPGELVRDADGRPVGCKGLKRA